MYHLEFTPKSYELVDTCFFLSLIRIFIFRIHLQNESEFNFKLTSLGISPVWKKIPDSLFKQKKLQLAELREQSLNV
jgi:hypothetical protein